MSMKLRTLVVTLPASSFSSFEPGATFCLRWFAMAVLACFTAVVPGPSLAGAGAGAVLASGAAAAGAGASRQGTAEAIRIATVNRRSMGSSWTARAGAEFTRRPPQAYHGDVPLVDGLRPAH